MDVLKDILLRSLIFILWGGGLTGILVGAGMIFMPQRIAQLNKYFSRWHASEKWEALMDRPHWVERIFYRHHRLLGAGILLGALIVLYVFLFAYNLRKVSPYIPEDYWWLLDALIGMSLLGATLSAMVGGIILTKPSLLRDIEASLNHWISTDYLTVLLNRRNFSAEQLLFRHHRIAGMSMGLCGLYILVVLIR